MTPGAALVALMIAGFLAFILLFGYVGTADFADQLEICRQYSEKEC